MRRKTIHRGKLINGNGRVSPLCADKPKAIDLQRESWTNRDDAVTCEKCLQRIAHRDPKPE